MTLFFFGLFPHGVLWVSFFLGMLHHPDRLSSLAMRTLCTQKDHFHGLHSVLALALPPISLTCKWEQDFYASRNFLGEMWTARWIYCVPGLCGSESHGCSMVNCREPKRGLHSIVGRIQTCVWKPQWISSPSPSPLSHKLPAPDLLALLITRSLQ